MEIKYIYLIVIGAMSLLTFLLFALDNAIAVGSLPFDTRIPEYALLVCMALGGGLGGLCGMVVCTHKTRKLSFNVLAILTCIINMGTAIALFIIGG